MKLEAKQRLQLKAANLFLPLRLVMIDCEMTGLQPATDDLIQIAGLKLELRTADMQYVETQEQPFNIYLHTDKQPESDFAREHLVEIYQRAQASSTNYVEARNLLNDWLGSWRGKVSPCGDCVPTDILFMYVKGVVELSHYNGDTPIEGSFHYEFFEINPLKAVARQKAGTKFDRMLPRIPGDHDALVDCKNQLTEMNGIIKVLLGEQMS